MEERAETTEKLSLRAAMAADNDWFLVWNWSHFSC